MSSGRIWLRRLQDAILGPFETNFYTTDSIRIIHCGEFKPSFVNWNFFFKSWSGLLHFSPKSTCTFGSLHVLVPRAWLTVNSHGLSSCFGRCQCCHEIKMLTPWKESYDQPRQHINKQRHYFVNKGLSSQGYGFSSGHVWMSELDYKESWVLKNWCFWTVVLEKTLESPLDCKEIQPVHPKGDQSWMFIGRTDVETETPILRQPDAKSWLIGKDPDAGKDWGQEEKGTTEDEMVGWHHRLDGHEWVNSGSW